MNQTGQDSLIQTILDATTWPEEKKQKMVEAAAETITNLQQLRTTKGHGADKSLELASTIIQGLKDHDLTEESDTGKVRVIFRARGIDLLRDEFAILIGTPIPLEELDASLAKLGATRLSQLTEESRRDSANQLPFFPSADVVGLERVTGYQLSDGYLMLPSTSSGLPVDLYRRTGAFESPQEAQQYISELSDPTRTSYLQTR